MEGEVIDPLARISDDRVLILIAAALVFIPWIAFLGFLIWEFS